MAVKMKLTMVISTIMSVEMKITMVMMMPMPAATKDLPEVELVAGLHVGAHARHLLDHHFHLWVKLLLVIGVVFQV